MKRGSIYWVNLEPTEPPEFGKVRPGLVVSSSEQNALLPTVVIVPLSSRPPEIWPLRLETPIPKGKKSYAVLPGIRQVHKGRLRDLIGMAPAGFLQKLDDALRAYLSD